MPVSGMLANPLRADNCHDQVRSPPEGEKLTPLEEYPTLKRGCSRVMRRGVGAEKAASATRSRRADVSSTR